MCKLRHKVLNGQNLPHGNPTLGNYCFLSNFTDNLSHCELLHKLQNSKNCVGPTLTL